MNGQFDNGSSARSIKILFLPNWSVVRLKTETSELQPPDKFVEGHGYWFFRHFSIPPRVTVIDYQGGWLFHFLEKMLGIYILQALKAFLVSKRYDIVMSHGAQSGLVYSLLNRLPGRLKRPKHVIVDIGGMNGGRRGKIECMIVRQALASTPTVICHSSSLLHFYENTYPSIHKSSVFIPFGVDTDEFRPQECEMKPQVLSFGYAKRDYQTLLSAWARIDTDVELKIIGSQIRRNANNVKFKEGVSLLELKKEIAQSLFVVIPLPYFIYSYGQMSFLQSMSMGKPVIVTQTPSSVDYLVDGEGAFGVPVGDPVALAEKISYYLKHRDVLTHQSRLAREYIEKNHSERIMASRFENLVYNLHEMDAKNE